MVPDYMRKCREYLLCRMALCLFLMVPLLLSAGEKTPQTLHRASPQIKGFDPVVASDVASSRAISLIYEGLLSYDYHSRPYRLTPLLAESMPEISNDGLTYRFHLKKNVLFADSPCFPGGRGRVVTSRDVIFSVKRMADARNASSGWWLLRGLVVGLDEFREQTVADKAMSYDVDVKGLRAVDDTTLDVELTHSSPRFLWALAMSYTAVVAREAVEYYGQNFSSNPVGTGPYMLKKWHRQYSLEFERNRNWQRRVLVGPSSEIPVATYESIRFLVIDDPSTQWLAFLQGQLDYVGEISRDNWDVVVTEDGKLSPELVERGINMQSSPALTTSYVAFNMDDPVVGTNAFLRQAMNCAFNGAEWAKFHNYRHFPATGPIPPGIAGRLEDSFAYGFDIEKARSLMRSAGYPGGIDPATNRRLTLTLDIGRADQQTRESTELLIAMMDSIGIVLRPEYYNWTAFLRRIRQRQSQMFRIAWVADYPDAENFLQLFYGPNDSPGPNRANYSNDEFNRKYDEAMGTTDPERRLILYRDMQYIVREDAPWLFLSHQVEYCLSHPWIENYKLHDFPYGMEKFYRRGGAR